MTYHIWQVLQGKPYDSSIDWWTLGCLVYEMLVGCSPFRSADMAILVQQIIKCRYKLPAHVPTQASSLIRQLLTADPTSRLGAPPDGAAALKRHVFFAELDWEVRNTTL